ncbi:hypothetical protein QM480_06650 [Flectobacillus sp. DC10W]|uniref:DUF7833 domain-containing protein n=1 Tax=Flectobacillus longus TaxID=2984207 RepID=A0ABT6YKB9_9BACT|nr:hypothetical protein [Flectobacillus longus]MDI9863995.1 hypothetical protein [Flectobacillus longus]
MNGYELSNRWYSWCSENNDIVTPNHHAVYFWCIEKCNRLGWPQSFSLPSDEAMHHLGIRSYKTYIKALEELISFGFLTLLQRSKNQYTANVIALVKNTKALPKQSAKQIQSRVQSTSEAQTKAVPKQSDHNKTNKLLNLETKKENYVKEKSTSSTTNVSNSEIPDFVLKEQKKITPYVADAPPLDEIEASMRNSQMLLEAGIRKNQITESEYYKYLEDFFLETRATDKKVKSESDHKKHFLAWLRIQIQNKPKSNTSGKMKTGFDEMSRALNRLENDETYE